MAKRSPQEGKPDWNDNTETGNRRMAQWLKEKLEERLYATLAKEHTPENIAISQQTIAQERARLADRRKRFGPLLDELQAPENEGIVSKEAVAQVAKFVSGATERQYWGKRGRPKLTNMERRSLSTLEEEIVWVAADDVSAIKAIWRKHYRGDRRTRGQMSADEFAAMIWSRPGASPRQIAKLVEAIKGYRRRPKSRRVDIE
jgi:hypothetical protein